MSKYVYYTKEYQGYAEELKDVDSLNSFTGEFVKSVSDAENVINRLKDNLSSQMGLSINELMDSALGPTFKTLEKAKGVLEKGLGPIVPICSRLAKGLTDLKTTEDQLIEDQDSKTTLDRNPVGRGTYDKETKKYSNQANYDEYIRKLENLKNSIDALNAACKELKQKDDSDIKAIKDFNGALETFSTALFSFSVSVGDKDFSGFDTLSVEEKNRIIDGLIADMTANYKALKNELESNKRQSLLAVFEALGGWDVDPYKPMSLETFFHLYDFFTDEFYVYDASEGDRIYRSGLEIVNAYFNGKSWEDSGMELLARQFDGFVLDLGYGFYTEAPSRGATSEGDFWHKLIWSLEEHSNDNTSELFVNTDYYAQYGGDPSVLGFAKLLSNDSLNKMVDTDNNISLREVLFDSLKKEFVAEKRLDGLNEYFGELETIYEESSGGALPILAALDGNIDWLDNNAVIPKDAVLAYFSGKGWEESGLARYCNKSEEEFILDLTKNYNRTVGPDLAEFNQTLHGDIFELNLEDGEFDICSLDRETLIQKIQNGEDVSQYIKEIKTGLVNNGSVTRFEEYHDYVDTKNLITQEQESQLMTLGGTIRGLKDLRSETAFLEYKKEDWFKDAMASGELSTKAPDGLDLGIHDGYDYNQLYNNMTDEEKVVFDHLWKTNGSSGRRYLADMANTINSRIGKQEATEFVESVLGNNMMSQDDYARKYASEHGISFDEAKQATLNKLKDDYKDVLINQYGYNPERAREIADARDYTGEKMYSGDDAVWDLLRTGGSGLGMGLGDLGTNIKHNFSPDMVMTVDNYKAEYIVDLFNSDEYNSSGLAAVYSGARTFGHKAPATILKAIPTNVTKALGTAIDFLDNSGAATNTAFQANGGNYGAALVYGTSKSGVGLLVDKATANLHIDGLTDTTNNMIKSGLNTFAKGSSNAVLDHVFVNPTSDLGGEIMNSGVDALTSMAKAGVYSNGDAFDNPLMKPIEKHIINPVTGDLIDAGGTYVKQTLSGEGGDTNVFGDTLLNRVTSSNSSDKIAGYALKGVSNLVKYTSGKVNDYVAFNEAMNNGFIRKTDGVYVTKDGEAYATRGALREDYSTNLLKNMNGIYKSSLDMIQDGTIKYDGLEDVYYIGDPSNVIAKTSDELIKAYNPIKDGFEFNGVTYKARK